MAEWKDWAEEEKKCFQNVACTATDYKTLQDMFKSYTKKLGRSTIKKIREAYYIIILNLKVNVEKSGINIHDTLPTDVIQTLNTKITSNTYNSSNIKKEIHKLIKSPLTFANLIRILANIASQKKIPSRNNMHLPSIDSADEECSQCCKKIRVCASPCDLPGVPDDLTVRFQPLGPEVNEVLTRNGYNPKLELTVQKTTILTDIVAYLNKKWCAIEGNENSISLFSKLGDSNITEHNSTEKITIGDIFLSLNSPVPFYMFYCWPSKDSEHGADLLALVEKATESLESHPPAPETEVEIRVEESQLLAPRDFSLIYEDRAMPESPGHSLFSTLRTQTLSPGVKKVFTPYAGEGIFSKPIGSSHVQTRSKNLHPLDYEMSGGPWLDDENSIGVFLTQQNN